MMFRRAGESRFATSSEDSWRALKPTGEREPLDGLPLSEVEKQIKRVARTKG